MVAVTRKRVVLTGRKSCPGIGMQTTTPWQNINSCPLLYLCFAEGVENATGSLRIDPV
jgi:hypothetical protein